MIANRVREIQQLLECCQQTDNTDLEAEKTAAIAELLTEVERLENSNAGGFRGLAQVLADVELLTDKGNGER
jgi:hypothetical protein